MPHSTGSLVAVKPRHSAQRVAFIAAALASGFFSPALIFASRSGSQARNASTDFAPFFLLQGSHANVKLDTRSEPLFALATTCSIWSGTFSLSQ